MILKAIYSQLSRFRVIFLRLASHRLRCLSFRFSSCSSSLSLSLSRLLHVRNLVELLFTSVESIFNRPARNRVEEVCCVH